MNRKASECCKWPHIARIDGKVSRPYHLFCSWLNVSLLMRHSHPFVGNVYCGEAFNTVLNHTSSKVAEMNDGRNCLIFDVDIFSSGSNEITDATKDVVRKFCGVSK